MYFLFRATERQHSITTGAHERLLGEVKVFTGIPLFLLLILPMFKSRQMREQIKVKYKASLFLNIYKDELIQKFSTWNFLAAFH